MELAIKAAVIAMLLANASIFRLTKGRPNFGALIGANLVCLFLATFWLGTLRLLGVL